MKLKFIRTCDEHGVKSENELHYWDEETECWELIKLDEIKSQEYDEFIRIE